MFCFVLYIILLGFDDIRMFLFEFVSVCACVCMFLFQMSIISLFALLYTYFSLILVRLLRVLFPPILRLCLHRFTHHYLPTIHQRTHHSLLTKSPSLLPLITSASIFSLTLPSYTPSLFSIPCRATRKQYYPFGAPSKPLSSSNSKCTSPKGQSFIHSYTRSVMLSLTHSLAHCLTHSLTHSLTASLTRSLTHSLTHSLIHSLTPYFIFSQLLSLYLILFKHNQSIFCSILLNHIQST